jgi:hypothetical protein
VGLPSFSAHALHKNRVMALLSYCFCDTASILLCIFVPLYAIKFSFVSEPIFTHQPTPSEGLKPIALAVQILRLRINKLIHTFNNFIYGNHRADSAEGMKARHLEPPVPPPRAVCRILYFVISIGSIK